MTLVSLVVPCRMLRWVCRKHSNDVARQVEILGKSTIFVERQCVLSHYICFMALHRLHYNITIKHLDTAKDVIKV